VSAQDKTAMKLGLTIELDTDPLPLVSSQTRLWLAFEGAGGACGEFDGVFGAGFFGVLF
jgi:hypothetical protein